MNKAIARSELNRLLTGAEHPIYESFTMAFQPVLDLTGRRIFGHEALVRAPGGVSAWPILSRIAAAERYDFDRLCRMKAIELAAAMNMPERLFINFMANAVLQPHNRIEATIDAAQTFGFPTDRIILEITEQEDVADMPILRQNVANNLGFGIRTAMDDFGAGYSGLNLLCRVTPDFIKVDRELIKGIDFDKRRHKIMASIMALLIDLGHIVIVEGVETYEEFSTLIDLGATMFQGYFIGRPQIGRLHTDDEILERILPTTQI